MRLTAPLALLVAAGLLLFVAPTAGAAIAYRAVRARLGAAVRRRSTSRWTAAARSPAPCGSPPPAASRRRTRRTPRCSASPAAPARPRCRSSPTSPSCSPRRSTTRDLLMFDQRGTGDLEPAALLAVRQLAHRRRPALRQRASASGAAQYTTAASVEDIEALRANSGYDKLVLYGVSYGTKVALDYAARYPDRVAGLILDSVVLPPGPDPLQRSTFAAMRRVLAELCAGGECAGISGNPAGDLASRVRSLARKPLRGLLTSARGVRQRVEIVRSDLFDVLLTGDLNPTLRAELPGALTSARKGDSAPLIRLVARSAGSSASPEAKRPATSSPTPCSRRRSARRATSRGIARSAPPAAHSRSTPPRARAGAAAFSPFDIATAVTTEMVSLCLGWPSTTGGYVPAGPLPDVPTLVIDGAADLRTPLEDAALVKSLIPSAQLLRSRTPAIRRSRATSPTSSAPRGPCSQFFLGQLVAPCAAEREPVLPHAGRADELQPPAGDRPRRQGRAHDHRRARDRRGHAPPGHRRRARSRAAAVARRRPARRARRRAQRDPHALQRRLRAGREGVRHRAAQRRPAAADASAARRPPRARSRSPTRRSRAASAAAGSASSPRPRPPLRRLPRADYRKLLRSFELRHAG